MTQIVVPLKYFHERQQENSAKRIISIHADQLLNITITKTGLDLLQRLSTFFNDIYNKRLPLNDDDDDEQPMLSVFNKTGRELLIDHLDGIEVK